MLLEEFLQPGKLVEISSEGGTAIVVRLEDDEVYMKLLCWPDGDVDDYSIGDTRNLSQALFFEKAYEFQQQGEPLYDFIPLLGFERGNLTTNEFSEYLRDLQKRAIYFPDEGYPPTRLVDVFSRLSMNDIEQEILGHRTWNYIITKMPLVDTNWALYLDYQPERDTDAIFEDFRRDAMERIPAIISDIRIENFGFTEEFDQFQLYIFDPDAYWVEPQPDLHGLTWVKSNLFELYDCRANDNLNIEDFPIIRGDIAQDLIRGDPNKGLFGAVNKAWESDSPYGLSYVEEEQLLTETLTCMRNNYKRILYSYDAEEVNIVQQFPIMYKKNATGTLQQWQVLIEPQESGGYLLTTESGKIDGVITRGRGKLITQGKVNRTALEQAELEANSKFKKKQDSGYFLTQEEALENLVLLPMKALDFKKRGHDIVYPAVAQRKFDGVRCLAIPQSDGSVRLMSRTGKIYTHLHHLQEQIESLNLDPNMVLDGEVYSDTLTFEEATGLVRRQTLKPGDAEKMNQIDYRLYDAILLDNLEATFLDRYAKLAALFPSSTFISSCRRLENLVLTENFPLRGPEDLMTLHHQFTQDEDFEGVMIRNLYGPYGLNKRSKHLQKFKEFQDAEYKIVGYNEASGNWQGTPIWICEMEDGRQFNVTPTGDRPSRIEMFNNIEDYMGKMLTVKFFELTADGVPRHGVGVAIRDYE